MPSITTRVISGKGLLRLPGTSSDLEKAQRLYLYVDVVRLPYNPYLNHNFNPPKGRYGTLNIFRQGYLMQEICISYPRQMFEFPLDISAQTNYLVKCNYHLLLAQLIEMSAKLGLLTDNSPDSLSAYKHQKLWFDEIKVVCYSDTALKLEVKTDELFLCPDDAEPNPKPPPEPPPEPTDVPPGTSLGDGNIPISPPYQGDDDGGDTVPFPGDEFPAPPEPIPGCWKITNSYSSTYPTGDTYTVGYSTDVPEFRLDGLWWQLHDAVSGRVMYYNWVGVAVTPTLISATFYEECPVPDPGGTLTGSP